MKTGFKKKEYEIEKRLKKGYIVILAFLVACIVFSELHYLKLTGIINMQLKTMDLHRDMWDNLELNSIQ